MLIKLVCNQNKFFLLCYFSFNGICTKIHCASRVLLCTKSDVQGVGKVHNGNDIGLSVACYDQHCSDKIFVNKGRVALLCVSTLGHLWFRKWLVTYSVPRNYLNQWWVIAHWTTVHKSQRYLNQNLTIFIHKNESANVVCKMSAICLGLNDVLTPLHLYHTPQESGKSMWLCENSP